MSMEGALGKKACSDTTLTPVKKCKDAGASRAKPCNKFCSDKGKVCETKKTDDPTKCKFSAATLGTTLAGTSLLYLAQKNL